MKKRNAVRQKPKRWTDAPGENVTVWLRTNGIFKNRMRVETVGHFWAEQVGGNRCQIQEDKAFKMSQEITQVINGKNISELNTTPERM